MMLTFWGVAIILLIATLGVLLRPLLWVQKGKPTESMQELQAIYRQQYAELEQDKANRLLDNQQYEIARNELARRLLEDTGNQPAKISTRAFIADKPLAVGMVLLIPIAAILIYLKVGNPQAITSHAMASAEQATQDEQATANIEAILKSLHERLEQDPADGAGWQLLARGYAKLHRYDEAAQAFEHASKVITDDPQLLTDYAIVLAMMQEQKLSGKPEQLIRQALKIEPNDPKALMLAASAAFDRRDYKEAIRLWTQLESQLPVGSEARGTVETALKRAAELSRQP